MGAVKSFSIPNVELNRYTVYIILRPFLDSRVQPSVADKIKTEANDSGSQTLEFGSKAVSRLCLINRSVGQIPFKGFINE